MKVAVLWLFWMTVVMMAFVMIAQMLESPGLLVLWLVIGLPIGLAILRRVRKVGGSKE